jgi:Mrp family chromosome partitioning ATPase
VEQIYKEPQARSSMTCRQVGKSNLQQISLPTGLQGAKVVRVAPVLTIAGLKGGVGKTTTAAALACLWSSTRRVLLVDADPNGSALRWHGRSEAWPGFACVPLAKAPPRRTASRGIWW